MGLHESFAATFLVAVLSVSSIANAALVSRMGGLAYYDDVADLTWLADANAAVGSIYDTYSPGSGRMNWADANAWAAELTVAGIDGWRLPDTIDVGNDGATYTNLYQGVDYGYNITTHSELSNMFFNVLGNTSLYDTSGAATGCTAPDDCLTNTGPFSNIQSNVFLSAFYWSATEYTSNTIAAWGFNVDIGGQGYDGKTDGNYAWAVQSGDVLAILPDGDLAPLGNPDGVINAADILIATRIVAGKLIPTQLELDHGDMNGDGVINMPDLINITKLVFP